MGNFEYIPCNICGKDDYNVKLELKTEKAPDASSFYASSNIITNDRIVQCKNCSLQYVNPRLNPAEILKGYADAEDPNYISESKGRTYTFKKSLQRIGNYKKDGKILDIGSAAGFFLNLAKQSGWDTYGLEPNKYLVKWGNENFGLKMQTKDLKDAKFPKENFDAVTMFDVLEHVPSPKNTLIEINRILKKDGILVVSYPDVESLPARILKSKWWFYLAVHIYYFTPETLKKLLDECGFEQLENSLYFNKLTLGYLNFRLGAYSKFLSRHAGNILKFFKMENINIPYYAGQKIVIARKKV